MPRPPSPLPPGLSPPLPPPPPGLFPARPQPHTACTHGLQGPLTAGLYGGSAAFDGALACVGHGVEDPELPVNSMHNESMQSHTHACVCKGLTSL